MNCLIVAAQQLHERGAPGRRHVASLARDDDDWAAVGDRDPYNQR